MAAMLDELKTDSPIYLVDKPNNTSEGAGGVSWCTVMSRWVTVHEIDDVEDPSNENLAGDGPAGVSTHVSSPHGINRGWGGRFGRH